jgi:hypothetical protein
MFRSPKKQEIVEYDENSLMTKEFKGLNIQVYGTHEEPLFKANDIGNLLEMSNIRETISSFNIKQRCDVSLTDAMGREQRTTFLTEQGLYKILMISRKPIAKHFQKWVRNIIKAKDIGDLLDIKKILATFSNKQRCVVLTDTAFGLKLYRRHNHRDIHYAKSFQKP